MLVLIEGPDGAGKTTGAKALATALRHRGTVHEFKAGPPNVDPDGAWQAYAKPLEFYRPGAGVHVVCDRWHVGEDVYGPLLRGHSLLEQNGVRRRLNRFLREKGALVVHLTEDPEVLRARCLDRGEDFIDLDQLESIAHRFQRAIARCPLPKLVLYAWDNRLVLHHGARQERRAAGKEEG